MIKLAFVRGERLRPYLTQKVLSNNRSNGYNEMETWNQRNRPMGTPMSRDDPQPANEPPKHADVERQLEEMEAQWPGRFSVVSDGDAGVGDGGVSESEVRISDEDPAVLASEVTGRVSAALGRPVEAPVVGVAAALRHEPGFRSLLVSTLLSLTVVLALLGIVRLSLPAMLEWCRYSWTRGQLRAEYELAGEKLSQVSVDGLGQVSQWVGQRVSPSVVHIDMQHRAKEGPRQDGPFHFDSLRVDQGSGVIIDAAGYILTNHHVIEDGDVAEVHLSDGRVLSGKIVGVDDVTDLALLKIEADNLLPIAWGNSDAMTVGMPVWAVGSPYGLMGTVTFGILSGKHRIDLSSARMLGNVKSQAEYSDLMQSDVAVNPGNSGGPLVNAQGELVGINTAIIGQSYRGISFAIPSNVARKVVDKLKQTGKMERGVLGLIIDELYHPKRDGVGIVGVKVARLVEDFPSPAKKAGLQVGDVITAIDGQSVESLSDLRRLVGEAYVGTPVRVRYHRQEAEQEIDVEVAPIPKRP